MLSVDGEPLFTFVSRLIISFSIYMSFNAKLTGELFNA